MVRHLVTSFILIICMVSTNAQVPSPSGFLGYEIGEKYTPHWKVVNYFKAVAESMPSMVKLQSYGFTNEGRPLLLAFVGSPENIAQLERIRTNNLRLAQLVRDNEPVAVSTAPAIVWLSYNVHGNETSSTEAAMLTLYALTNPAETKAREWLKNTVVVIDPCINPDGRDRYVNWFNSVVGKQANAYPGSREHREPWPGGRTNHYNFDLNRDWAWQTQVESEQRVKVYNQWMPHVHVDFHEMGYNEPYYFAPAAQPYHEVITPWQRDFQVTIGRNHAKYFDAKNWLYFTREIFDLYYPSYGDTYPTYNGAIGMTYEQGGGPAGGAAVVMENGDTLTLRDRVQHHYTTSLSTIEVSSVNAGKLVKEFQKYFTDNVSAGAGEYKTYIIKHAPQNVERIRSLVQLLDKNGIQYGTGNAAGKGYRYSTGKEESFSVGSGDIIISALQPRAPMVKVLFEPKGKLVDSLTYDITAWSLPYVYGVEAFATKERIQVTGKYTTATVENPSTTYGYVIPWLGLQTVKVVGQLLQKDILLRYAEFPFEVNGQQFDRGAVIVLKTNNQKLGDRLWEVVRETANAQNVRIYPVSTGFVDKGYDFGSPNVHTLKAPKVALLTGEGINSSDAGEVWHFFDVQIGYPVTLINVADFARIPLKDFDVLVMPSGSYRFLSDKAATEAFKEWVEKGGRVVALDEAVTALSKAEFGIKLKKGDEDKGEEKDAEPGYEALRRFEDRERDQIPGFTPGSIFKVELDNTHPLAFGYPGAYYTLKMDNKIYEFFKDGAWNVGVLKRDNQVAGFVGHKLKPRLKDGLLFGVQSMGRGTVTYLADNVLFRNFWENGKLMFCNAVFLVGQ